ncbi:hypothetical protein C6499_01910 [Candidatus Poribacteria bacterium]|nr:MAG: hypothetical protein C6499_01910 [Candidatus Poribacteria bacterium]
MPNAIGLMKDVIATYANNPKWVDAPLGDIKILSNTHIGNVGQDFIQQWCDVENLNWELPKSTQSPWDIRIESISFEVKTATEDVNDKFQFNHIRHHRDYQALLVLGIAPDKILFNAWRKGDVVEGKAGRLVTMDKGSSATFKLTKKPSELLPITEFTHRINEIARSLA